MPRTVLWLMAAGAVAIAAILGEAWRGEPGEPAILGQAAKAAATSPAAPAPSPPVDAATPQTAAPPSVPSPTVAMPSFDIALIGRDGRGVIAGRAQPGPRSSCSMATRSWPKIRPMQTANGSSLHRIRR